MTSLRLARFASGLAVILAVLSAATAAADEGGVDPYKTVIVTSTPSAYFGVVENPYAGILRGTAEVIRSQGEALIMEQQARLLQEKVQQKKLETRRQELEQWVWERDFFAEETIRQRERAKRIQTELARDNPPLTEVLSGKSLNVLLDALKDQPNLSLGASAQVKPDWLAHVNTTYAKGGANAGGGNVGLLKEDKLTWPMFLRRSTFDRDREQIDRLFALVKKQLLAGRLEAREFDMLGDALKALDDKLRNMARNDTFDESPTVLVGARRFVRQLQDVRSMLGDSTENAAFYLRPLEGRTVAELVGYMKTNGLQFAPATTGCERYYAALRQALADEVRQYHPPPQTGGQPQKGKG
jgi:hypothetical protein